MPVETAQRNYCIQNLKIGSDNRGPFISAVCPDADSFALCFVKGDLASGEEVKAALSEQDLKALRLGNSIERGRLRFQGVRRMVFYSGPVYYITSALPPERVQIFALSYSDFYDVTTLYFPEDETSQSGFLPLRFSYELKQVSPEISNLVIKLKDNGVYEDGTLLYQVGNALPIPIPQEGLGKGIKLYLPSGEKVMVVVREEYRDRMRLI